MGHLSIFNDLGYNWLLKENQLYFANFFWDRFMGHCLGSLFIVAAPSGGGKTSLVKHLVAELPFLEVSVSHTTRAKRQVEEEGIDYFFLNEAQFLDLVEAAAFVEHSKVFNHYYGTSSVQINEKLQRGVDVVLDIDWQGAQQIKAIFPDSLSIFILPPSMEALEHRLKNRQQDDSAIIADRMMRARDELSHYDEFDYLIVNDQFHHALNELKSIVLSARLRTIKQKERHRKLLSFLLASQ